MMCLGFKPRMQDCRRRRIHWAMAAPFTYVPSVTYWNINNVTLFGLLNSKVDKSPKATTGSIPAKVSFLLEK